MESLSAFLKTNAIKKEPVRYTASKRFVTKDDAGVTAPVEWQLRALTNDEIESLRKKHTKKIPIKGTNKYQTEMDNESFMVDMTLDSVVYPNLNDEELQTSWGVVGAEALLKAMLTPGELVDLELAVNEASDFEVGMKDKIAQVKNS